MKLTRSSRELVYRVLSLIPIVPAVRGVLYTLRLQDDQRAVVSRLGEQVKLNMGGVHLQLDLRQLHDYLAWKEISQFGWYEPGTTKVLLHALKAGDTFLDVGANNGYFSVLAAGRVGSSGRVLAFEPNPSSYSRLLTNRSLNPELRNITSFRVALSDHSGTARLDTTSEDDGSASIRKDSSKYVDVPTRSADELIGDSRVDVVKVDVEGHELQVLRGLNRLLDSNPSLTLIVEWNSRYGTQELWDALSRRFRLFRIEERPPTVGDLTPVNWKAVRLIPLANLWCQPLERYK
jgi:FkbM family methyltransferase